MRRLQRHSSLHKEDRIDAQHSSRVAATPRSSRRRFGLYAGIGILAAAWLTPLPQLIAPELAGRTLVHVAVIALAAPLIAGALVVTPQVTSRLPRSLVSPLPAALVEFSVLWLWYIPILHGLARLSPWVWAAEQASLFVAALLLWTATLRPSGRGQGGAGAGILALLGTAMHMALLGTLLAFTPWPLYIHAIETLGDVYAQLAGQRVGGMLMLLCGLLHLAAGLYLVSRLLRRPPEPTAAVRYVSPADGGYPG